MRFVIQYWRSIENVGDWRPINSEGIETLEEAIRVAESVSAKKKTTTRVLKVEWTSKETS